jgi:hypothetical protein
VIDPYFLKRMDAMVLKALKREKNHTSNIESVIAQDCTKVRM